MKVRLRRVAYKNDILIEDNWHVVRNERDYSLYGEDKKYIFFNVYHFHEGEKFTGLCTADRSWIIGGCRSGGSVWTCTSCQTESPDIINGYMNLIEWSMSHDD